MIAKIFDHIVNGDIVSVQEYISSGNDINIKDDEFNTPFLTSCKYNNLDVTKLLVESGANVKSRNKKKQHALIIACDNNNYDTLEYLCNTVGMDINMMGGHRWTALNYAISSGNKKMISFLINNCKAFPYNKTLHGETPLLWTCLIGKLDIVKYLIEDIKLEPNQINDYSYTPIHNAVAEGHLEIVKYLLEKGYSNFNTEYNEKGHNAFQEACERGHNDIVEWLINNKDLNIDVNSPNKVGDTPYFLAAEEGKWDTCDLLEKYGAIPVEN